MRIVLTKKENSMKRIIKFSLMKIIEIGLAFSIWLGFSGVGYLIFPDADTGFWIKWGLLPSMVAIWFTAIGGFLYSLKRAIISWIKWNWEKAGK